MFSYYNLYMVRLVMGGIYPENLKLTRKPTSIGTDNSGSFCAAGPSDGGHSGSPQVYPHLHARQ